MAPIVLYMAMSLDGFTTGPDAAGAANRSGATPGEGECPMLDAGFPRAEAQNDWLRAGDELASPDRSYPATRGGARWAR